MNAVKAHNLRTFHPRISARLMVGQILSYDAYFLFKAIHMNEICIIRLSNALNDIISTKVQYNCWYMELRKHARIRSGVNAAKCTLQGSWEKKCTQNINKHYPTLFNQVKPIPAHAFHNKIEKKICESHMFWIFTSTDCSYKSNRWLNILKLV